MTDDRFQPGIKIAFHTDKDLETIEIVQMDTINGQIQRHIMRLRDEGTRAALIELGWTPPADEGPKS